MSPKKACRCIVCNRRYDRVLRSVLAAVDVSLDVGNVEGSLCPACEVKFRAWLRETGYLSTDCWCQHLEEFKAVMRG